MRESSDVDDDDVYYYIRWRLKLEGETENMGVCTKERKGITAAVLMATPCTGFWRVMMMMFAGKSVFFCDGNGYGNHFEFVTLPLRLPVEAIASSMSHHLRAAVQTRRQSVRRQRSTSELNNNIAL